MDFTSLIEIIAVIVVIYLFIRFIVSPVLKAVVGIIIFIVLIYLLQRYMGFNFDQILAPFGISFNSSKWGLNLNWLFGPINYYVDQISSFFHYILKNIPKSGNQ